MTQAASKSRVSFEEYIDFCAQTDERYELVQGELYPMNPPTMLHYRIAKFLERVFDQAIEEHLDPEEWETVRELGQRTDIASSRLLDVAIVSKAEAETLLRQTAVFQNPSLLVVEIVSPSSVTEDYDRKLKEYEALGVGEYWIVDYEGLGAAKYLGFPKAPTLSVCRLVEGKYEAKRFRSDEPIESFTFGQMKLTAEQVFAAGKQKDT
ncbi:Uma2 family endonuclease [Leptolyngbya ohadii]|uniref:Uma2 family endonuclease n=1 Tax=Leptolyngbya ohadii TaxID=1962290 RepID=UPI000B59854D|nr:Uma2 family endonuclease [Leptolyngbya ohadii]